MKRKIMSAVLAAAMVCTAIGPVTAQAADEYDLTLYTIQ